MLSDRCFRVGTPGRKAAAPAPERVFLLWLEAGIPVAAEIGSGYVSRQMIRRCKWAV